MPFAPAPHRHQHLDRIGPRLLAVPARGRKDDEHGRGRGADRTSEFGSQPTAQHDHGEDGRDDADQAQRDPPGEHGVQPEIDHFLHGVERHERCVGAAEQIEQIRPTAPCRAQRRGLVDPRCGPPEPGAEHDDGTLVRRWHRATNEVTPSSHPQRRRCCWTSRLDSSRTGEPDMIGTRCSCYSRRVCPPRS